MFKLIHHPTLKDTIKNTAIVLLTILIGSGVFQLLDMLVRRVLLVLMR